MARRTDLLRVAREFEDGVRQIKGGIGQGKGAPNCVEVVQRCDGILVYEVQPRGSRQPARPISKMAVIQFAKPTPQVDVPPLPLCAPNHLLKRELCWTAEA